MAAIEVLYLSLLQDETQLEDALSWALSDEKRSLVLLTSNSHQLSRKAMQSVFRVTKKVSKGRFLNLSERASWMNRETDVKDFPIDGEKCRLGGNKTYHHPRITVVSPPL